MSTFTQKDKTENVSFPVKSGAKTTRNGQHKAAVKEDKTNLPKQIPLVQSSKQKELRPQTSLAKETFSFTKPPAAKRDSESFDLVHEMMKPLAQLFQKEEAQIQRPKTSVA